MGPSPGPAASPAALRFFVMKREQLAFRFVLIAFESDPACATVVVVKEIMRTAGIDKAWEYFIRETLTSWGWATEKPSFLSSRLLWTDEGRECARRLQQAARQKVWRDSHLHHALMTWTYEHSPAGGSADLEQFGDADDWWFAGTPVTWEEVIDAVQYLEAEGLLTVNRSDRFYVQPTSIGVKFMHSKEDLSTFLARQTRSAGGVAHHYRGSIVVHGDASGAALVTGDNNALTFNQGAGAIALRSFVAQLRQIAPSLSLP